MKQFVQKILGLMARSILWRRSPFVIGITGSIGKTTTKDALYTILQTHTTVRTNIGNYNNEFGVPLTVIGTLSGGRSLLGWLRVGCRWLWSMTLQWNYPKVLVLEFGIDQVGDMDYLVDMVHPNMAIVTIIEAVHAEKFGSIATIAREKGVLVRRLDREATAILNADDARVMKMASHTKANVMTYSTYSGSGTSLCASDIFFNSKNGIAFKINEGQVSVPIRLPHIIGTQMVPSIVAAMTAARAYGMNLADIAQAISAIEPPERRMNLVHGQDGITIIDDTYNAAPASMRSALATLGTFRIEGKEARRIAILGDMRELGSTEEKEHRKLAQSIIINRIDAVVCVGPLMKHLYDALAESCKKEYQVTAPYCFTTTKEACDAIGQIVTPGDVVLFKGSNGMHMWDVAEKLMER